MQKKFIDKLGSYCNNSGRWWQLSGEGTGKIKLFEIHYKNSKIKSHHGIN